MNTMQGQTFASCMYHTWNQRKMTKGFTVYDFCHFITKLKLVNSWIRNIHHRTGLKFWKQNGTWN